MEPRDSLPSSESDTPRSGTRVAWHALAMLLALAIAWLVFAAYRQPDFILDFAGIRLC
ncbi:MAG TPA: hypothetical protein VN858_10010 [Casimicrobiaceae bacterium]|nr:hypothetical protein [Casimicrobiaceae bacterium]